MGKALVVRIEDFISSSTRKAGSAGHGGLDDCYPIAPELS